MAGPSWGDMRRAARRVMDKPPSMGLTGGNAPRGGGPYHGFVRVIGEQLGSGHHLGYVTEHSAETDTFVNREDVPVWIRTPMKTALQVWRPGCPNGVGVYWGRAQSEIQLSGSGVTGTGTGTEGQLVTGTGNPDSWTLPLYIVDDNCCPPVECGFEGVECQYVEGGLAAEQVSVNVAGITGFFCTEYNGDWTLTFLGSCVWRYDIDGSRAVTLTVESNGSLTLNFIYPGQVVGTYTAAGPWDGQSSVVFTFVGETTGPSLNCGDWPATLTVDPVL